MAAERGVYGIIHPMIGLLTSALLLAKATGVFIPADVPPRVCTVREMNDVLYSSSNADILLTTGTVQMADGEHCIIEDRSGRAFFKVEDVPNARPGDVIEVVCRKYILRDHNKLLSTNRIKVTGKGRVTPPMKMKLCELDDRRDDLLLVETEATVIDVLPDDVDARYDVLLLKDGAERIPLFVPTSSENAALNGARIRLTARYYRQVSGERLVSGPYLSSSRNGVKVIGAAPNPFAVPVLNPDDDLTPQDIAAMDLRMLEGVVLATWGGNSVMLQSGNIASIVSLARGRPLPPIGQRVLVSGYPETDLYKINLVRADWKAVPGKPEADKRPRDITLGEITRRGGEKNEIDARFFGHLVRLSGTLRALPNDASAERRFLLDTDGERVAVDFSCCPEATDGLLPGSEIEVTGRCLLEANAWRPYDVFPRITGVAILMRTPEDLRVLRTPSWWTAERLLYLVAAMGLLLLGIFIWNRILNRLADRRGRQLYKANIERAEETLRVAERTRLAVELHDSLAQSITGASMQIDAAYDLRGDAPEEMLGHLDLAAKTLKSCRDELRNCLWDLRSQALEETDMTRAVLRTLQPHLGDVRFAARFNVPRSKFSDNTAHAVLCIVRELVLNALRHGRATDIRVAGSHDADAIRFSVRDNGAGFTPDDCPGVLQGHFGLQGIRERVAKLGGRMEIDSAPGRGTQVTVHIPHPEDIP